MPGARTQRQLGKLGVRSTPSRSAAPAARAAPFALAAARFQAPPCPPPPLHLPPACNTSPVHSAHWPGILGFYLNPNGPLLMVLNTNENEYLSLDKFYLFSRKLEIDPSVSVSQGVE